MLLQAVGEFGTARSSNVYPIGIDDYGDALRIKPAVGIFFTDGKYPALADCESVPYESNSILFFFFKFLCAHHFWISENI